MQLEGWKPESPCPGISHGYPGLSSCMNSTNYRIIAIKRGHRWDEKLFGQYVANNDDKILSARALPSSCTRTSALLVGDVPVRSNR